MGLKQRSACCRWGGAILVATIGLSVLDGCADSSDSVSATLFLAPVTDSSKPQGGVRTLVEKLDFLTAAEPDTLPAELLGGTADLQTIARVAPERVLLFETREGSVFSVNYGGDEFDDPDCVQSLSDNDLDGVADCERVKLHYTREGLSEAVRTQQAAIPDDVQPIQLQNGWVIAFETTTRSIIGFREEPPQDIPLAGGGSVTIPYRTSGNPENLNFGSGNGVVVTDVVSDVELRQKTGGVAVSGFVEIERNKVLVLFDALAAIHLLELEEFVEDEDWDLENDFDDARDVISTRKLTGTIKLFQRVVGGEVFLDPFLGYAGISAVTQSVEVNVREFPPPLLPDGSALYFDRATNNFLAVSAVRSGDVIVDGSVRLAASRANLQQILVGQDVLGPGDGLLMSASYSDSAGRSSDLLIMEEVSNQIIAYDPEEAVGSNLELFVPQADIVDPRTVDGGGDQPGITDPQLRFAFSDVDDNRLAFDLARDQVVGISYSAGSSVVTLGTLNLLAATGESIADLSFIAPLDFTTVRAFDRPSARLLDIKLRYEPLPVTVSN